MLNETIKTEEIHYGNYYPTWNPNHEVQLGEKHFQYYKIPDYVIDSSSTRGVNQFEVEVFVIYPQVEVLEVYGYA